MNTSPKLEAFQQSQVALDRARRESERLRTEAIQDLLQARKQVDAELKQLGYTGRGQLSDDDGGSIQYRNGGSGQRARRARQAAKKPHCPFCDMDGHDGRAHRGQGDDKRKFTTSELYARGLGIPPRPSNSADDTSSQ